MADAMETARNEGIPALPPLPDVAPVVQMPDEGDGQNRPLASDVSATRASTTPPPPGEFSAAALQSRFRQAAATAAKLAAALPQQRCRCLYIAAALLPPPTPRSRQAATAVAKLAAASEVLPPRFCQIRSRCLSHLRGIMPYYRRNPYVENGPELYS